MIKTILLVILALLLNACAVTRDGVRLGGSGGANSQKQVDELKNRLATNLTRAVQDEMMTQPSMSQEKNLGVIVIGELGPYRALSERELKSQYKFYAENAKMFDKDAKVKYAEEEFIKTFSGWTSVEVWGIPGIANRRQEAIVPRAIAEKMNYSYTLTSNMFGTTGDLVVCIARTDGMFFVEKVLCHEDDKECYKSYRKGVYEINTGRELTYDYKLMNNKIKINTETYIHK